MEFAPIGMTQPVLVSIAKNRLQLVAEVLQVNFRQKTPALIHRLADGVTNQMIMIARITMSLVVSVFAVKMREAHQTLAMRRVDRLALIIVVRMTQTTRNPVKAMAGTEVMAAMVGTGVMAVMMVAAVMVVATEEAKGMKKKMAAVMVRESVSQERNELNRNVSPI